MVTVVEGKEDDEGRETGAVGSMHASESLCEEKIRVCGLSE